MHNILRYRPLLTMIYATGGGGGGTTFSGRNGSVSADNASTSKAITFNSALSAATYAVIATFSNVTDSTPEFQGIVVTTLAVGGFTASWNGGLDSANYVINYLAQPTASSATSQAGTATIASGASTKAITFGTAMSSSNYSIQASFSNVTDATPQFQDITITAQSTAGFTASWNAATDTANYVLNYIVTAN